MKLSTCFVICCVSILVIYLLGIPELDTRIVEDIFNVLRRLIGDVFRG